MISYFSEHMVVPVKFSEITEEKPIASANSSNCRFALLLFFHKYSASVMGDDALSWMNVYLSCPRTLHELSNSNQALLHKMYIA